MNDLNPPINAFTVLRDAEAGALAGAVVAIGNFDGLHRGHSAVIDVARVRAKQLGRKAAALTFTPHPRKFFRPHEPLFQLSSERDKLRLLAGAGLDGAIVMTFDAALASTTALDFVEKILVGRFGIAGAATGFDFHFGKDRGGSPEFLREQGARLGFAVDIVPPLEDEGRPVSSGAVRTALSQGKVMEAAELLGHPWFVSGEVVHGDKRGRELGFPTANIRLDPECGLKHGIYAVRAGVGGRRVDGVASFGVRPMFESATPLLEVYLLDFDGDLYGQTIDVAFIGWLRHEQKFSSIEALKRNMMADVSQARVSLERAGKAAFPALGATEPVFAGTPSPATQPAGISENMPKTERDYSETLFLPQTDFPMRAGLPGKEPEILARWEKAGLYEQLRVASSGRAKFVLHDGPPYANGPIHIGTALNKILKDLVTRSQQMLGFDSNYVPGWDCHGLPIEWKIEEENYRSRQKPKPDLKDPEAMVAFRQECRAYAEHWLGVQREEFKRLGVIGDWAHPYTTMAFHAEAQIARELMKFAANKTLFRGSKPVMWSVVEKTALAEAEVEYEDYTSDTVWVKFPVKAGSGELAEASIVIWTTTPWTLPGNRAVSFSPKIKYALYKVTDAPQDNWAKFGDLLVLSENLAGEVFKQARVEAYDKLTEISTETLTGLVLRHPLADKGYDFDVPLLAGDHVTDDAGTGFVHTAPGHGREDFEVWSANRAALEARGINPAIPYTVDENGAFTDQAPGFTGKRVINDKGEKGDANEAVIKALLDAHTLIARGRLKHQYPHSWRSKKPIIFRNTPQWFIAMDKGIDKPGDTLRARAMQAIRDTHWVPPQGENRINGMVGSKPDWVISRQRAWGVPIAVFITEKPDGSVDILEDPEVNVRIIEAFEAEGADAWYKAGARERFLGQKLAAEPWKKVDDILDVWFDSGSTHAFVLEDPVHFPSLAGIKRKRDGGKDSVLYLEGSDQHRGWFQSSLLESCGTRGRAPFDVVVTHGFTLAEDGRKMSKSLGNTIAPQDVIKQSGADILRMWVASADYWDDQRIGPEILKTTTDTYRKLRNTIRWMLGNLAHFHEDERVKLEAVSELERLMLHRLAELDVLVREAYAAFDYKRIFAALSAFMTADLSAFYFDIRKDALYCDPISSVTRKACLTVLDDLFRCTVIWLAPMLCFTAEESWASRYGAGAASVHLEVFPELPPGWRDDKLAERWRKVRAVRRAVTGALEIERAGKRIGSSLEAHPIVHVSNPELFEAVVGIDLAEVCITSAATLVEGEGPADAFRLPDVAGVAVVTNLAEGTKCARSWKILTTVGDDPKYPDVSPRDAKALQEWETRKAAE
jgi:isoleucyl-tRNA synthetase